MAQVLLLLSFLGAFGFLGYYSLPSAVRFEDFAEMCVLVLFSWLAVSTRVDAKWVTYVFLPALGTASFVLFYAYVFTVRVDAALLPSILAQRYYLFVLLGPITYMLCARGWELLDFQRVVVVAMLLATAAFIIYDVTVSPSSVLLSGKFFVLQLGQAYEGLGTDIRRLDVIALFLMLYYCRRIRFASEALSTLFALAVITICAALLIITIPRALLVSAGVALILYIVFLSRPGRAKVSLITLPLYLSSLVFVVPYLRNAFIEVFGMDQSYRARIAEARIAWRFFQEYPLIGFGQDSIQSISYQDLFGQFYPSDLGLLGVAFQFGLLGLILYIAFVTWLCVNLLKLVWACDNDTSSRQGAFVWTLFIISMAFLVTSPVQARFIFTAGQGLPIGALSWGLLMAYKHGPPRYAKLSSRTYPESVEVPQMQTDSH
jgi:hypothetical protein